MNNHQSELQAKSKLLRRYDSMWQKAKHACARGVRQSLDDFLYKLDGVRRVGDRYIARCPAHADETPSLSVGLSDRGRILLHCHAGCSYQQIVTATETRRSDSFSSYAPLDASQMSMIDAGKKPPRNIAALATLFSSQIESTSLRRLVRELGASARSLMSLGLGWHKGYQAWTFPMWNSLGHIIGIRLRSEAGKKFAVRGSKNGLFIPISTLKAPLFICEGPTDTAAMLDLGFFSIGRASCNSGVSMVAEYIRLENFNDVVIVADNDTSGMRGANSLADTLSTTCQLVKIITPPRRHKDVRAWKQAGAKHRTILNVVRRARNTAN